MFFSSRVVLHLNSPKKLVSFLRKPLLSSQWREGEALQLVKACIRPATFVWYLCYHLKSPALFARVVSGMSWFRLAPAVFSASISPGLKALFLAFSLAGHPGFLICCVEMFLMHPPCIIGSTQTRTQHTIGCLQQLS